MKVFIEKNLNLILFISVIVGLTLPGVELIPSIVVTFLLGILVFFLCAKISVSEIKGVAIKEVVIFYVVRFICLPILLFYLADAVVPRYAVGVLLLALMPVGTSTPTLVATIKGNVTLAFVLMITSSLLAPFVIPVIFMMNNASSDLKISGLFFTLFSVVFIPFVAYFSLVSIRKESKLFIANNRSFVAVTLTGAIIAIVVSKQREVFLTDIGSLLLVLVLLSVVFLVFYVFGWFYPDGYRSKEGNRSKSKKVSYSMSSGATNTAIGINLALVYFSADTLFFMVLSEFLWIVSIPLFNMAQKRLSNSTTC